ncbi:MAG: hypothetical protein WC722_19390 [Rhodospirillales bacterium]
MADADSVQRADPTWEWVVLLALPVGYLVSALVLRANMGPFWTWHAIDPSYFYLLDSANLVNLTTPGHVAHPGTPVQVLGALVLWVMHGFAGADATIRAVIADPEVHLRAIGTVILGLNALALAAAGGAARLAFGGVLPALMVQSGPFVSRVIIHNGLYVKPESLLIFAALALAAVTLWALRDDRLAGHKRGFAIAFGVVAGFAMATKVSAAPLFVLPVFLLWGVRPLATYAGVAAVSFVVFTLPAAGAYDQFFSWMGRVATGSGHFGEGPQTVIDVARYPRDVIRLFSRPVLFVPLVLSLVALTFAWHRRSKASARQQVAFRALAGLVLAQILHVLVVARHPSAHYLVPSLVLSGLAMALLYRVVAGMGIGSARLRRHAWQTVIAVFSVFLIAQAVAVARQDLELHHWRTEAMSIDNARFRQCARVYFQFASDPVYALFLGNFITRQKLTDRIARRAPANDFWFDVVSRQFRDAQGPRDVAEVLVQYPCAFFRGQDRAIMESYLRENVPGFAVRDVCSTRDETVLTSGVDCTGELTGR